MGRVRGIPTGFRPPAQGWPDNGGPTLGYPAGNPQPQRGCVTSRRRAGHRTKPRWGCHFLRRFPRVGAGRQPWAEGRNPFGIEYVSAPLLLEPLGNEVPVDNVEERGHVLGALVLVFQVVGMLPHVE